MEILGYLGAFIAGCFLGLMGSGGSILTVPILVYVMGIVPVTATAYSLFVVGVSATTGILSKASKHQIHLRTAISFALPSAFTIYVTRHFFLPAIPDELFTLYAVTVSKDTFILLLFSGVMMLSSFAMLKKRRVPLEERSASFQKNNLLLFEGMAVGFIAGMVGAGGGFLIVPILVLLSKLTMKEAIATSLLIITVNSLFGFLGSIQSTTIDWMLLAYFTGAAIVGTMVGVHFAAKMNEEILKKIFGWFVLLLAIYIFVEETVKLM